MLALVEHQILRSSSLPGSWQTTKLSSINIIVRHLSFVHSTSQITRPKKRSSIGVRAWPLTNIASNGVPIRQLHQSTRNTMTAPVDLLTTLHHVTERKLSKLAAHREKYEADKDAILAKVNAASDRRGKVQALLDGFELYGIKPSNNDLSLKNLERFIHQAKHDPSVSNSLLQDWQCKLERELDVKSLKYEYAALFGRLVTEWIRNPNSQASMLGSTKSEYDSDSELSEVFSQVGRKEMHEQRAEWEQYAFTERKVDQHKIEEYLNEIFGTTLQAKKIKKTPLQLLRDSMKNVMDFKSDLQSPKRTNNPVLQNVVADPPQHRFTMDSLKSSIRGVLMSDLFAGEKRDSLVDLQSRPTVLSEMVDVLNMDLEGLDTWNWEPAPVPLSMRRQLNGKYRVFMDEEIHQAILLHFVGKTWAAALKKAFTAFYHSGAWLQTPYRSMSKKARQRREYFVHGSTNQPSTVRNHRRETFQKEYFMTQLPDNNAEDYRDYAAWDQDERSANSLQTPLATKQAMLRLVTAEMLLNTKIYGEFTVLQSDFKWFGPSLPHDTIFAVLKFFGVPGKWLRFFKKFLEAPVVFSQDGPGAQAQTRKCGIPMSHILSDALSEAVLFCLDFAVNKRTSGANIYRFHDDLWFFGQESTCIKAWHAIQEFSSTMGLQLNKEKTGAALVVANKDKSRPIPPALPKGTIKWGFLYLDAEAGRWVIDRAQVDEHIEELRRQLGACRSVMAWVQAWNSYVSRFFSTNFGQPANCFGRKHNEMIIDTFEHIQRSLFADAGSANVTDYLRGMLKKRFDIDNSIPDGFFYFPIELGGLGLRNPFISVFATYKKSFRDPGERIDRAFEDEQEEYERLKESWDSGDHKPKRLKYSPLAKEGDGTESEADEPFMSFEEYTRYREEVSMHLRNAYTNLLECPPEERVDTTIELNSALRSRGLESSPYWIWIYNLYAGDMKQRFGGLQLGERDLLPVGLVDVLKSEKVRWEKFIPLQPLQSTPTSSSSASQVASTSISSSSTQSTNSGTATAQSTLIASSQSPSSLQPRSRLPKAFSTFHKALNYQSFCGFVIAIVALVWTLKSYQEASRANNLSMRESCRQHPNDPILQDTPLCQEMRKTGDYDHLLERALFQEAEFEMNIPIVIGFICSLVIEAIGIGIFVFYDLRRMVPSDKLLWVNKQRNPSVIPFPVVLERSPGQYHLTSWRLFNRLPHTWIDFYVRQEYDNLSQGASNMQGWSRMLKKYLTLKKHSRYKLVEFRSFRDAKYTNPKIINFFDQEGEYDSKLLAWKGVLQAYAVPVPEPFVLLDELDRPISPSLDKSDTLYALHTHDKISFSKLTFYVSVVIWKRISFSFGITPPGWLEKFCSPILLCTVFHLLIHGKAVPSRLPPFLFLRDTIARTIEVTLGVALLTTVVDILAWIF
ncbi:hypothetical protein CC78DRAFT_575267 [Lojkania enalia]|uniref:Reverse transcriptase domain-containing protein n=1 Tax=Lojkania enalia TaxID=147567 RepID=A0A9P4N9M5_9PLEO|nr:hypothetical protein CC78DRAFT_575267 [Didymosphaeria enalia]